MIRFLFLMLMAVAAHAQSLPSGCEVDGSLTGRTDVIWCEKWESSTWWQNGYTESGSKTSPVAAAGPDRTEITSANCISGNCLQANIPSCTTATASGVLAHHKVIPGTKQEVYLRYYLKLGTNFSPNIFEVPTCANGTTGGKFPGLADVRASPEPQCGNGGDFSDGINCWSGRAAIRNCTSSSSLDGTIGTDICSSDIHGQQATTRYGMYWYLPGGVANETNQAFGLWDTWRTGTAAAGGDNCLTNPLTLGNWATNASDRCGKVTTLGNGGLINNHWYLIEWYIKMNTAGVADGIARGWINGQLAYEKTNVRYRLVGHDDLHVRTVWLDIHLGGENLAPLLATNIYLDELVVVDASGWGGDMTRRPGAWKKPGSARTTGSTVTVTP